MKRKALCFALALLMCMVVTAPAFADSAIEMSSQKTDITASFGLKHISGSTYRMWAKISNPTGATVSATLTLYDVSYTPVTSVSGTSSLTIINLSKDVSLSSGTYHLRLSYTVDGTTYSAEKTYTI
ncbi:hypothetical protein [Paenibacillus sp.]